MSPHRRKHPGKHLHGLAVHTGWHDAALPPAQPEPWSVVEHQPRDVPGCQVAVFRGGRVRNVAGVCLTSQCLALTRPNQHLTAAKALSSAHVQRKGTRVGRAGTGVHGARPVW